MSLEPQPGSVPEIDAQPVALPTWEQMTDLDRGAAVLHCRTRADEGAAYAVENYPCRYFDDPVLAALDDEVACEHAVSVTESYFTAPADDLEHALAAESWLPGCGVAHRSTIYLHGPWVIDRPVRKVAAA